MKKEIRNKFFATCSAMKAGAVMRRQSFQDLMHESGVISSHEHHEHKNRMAEIKAGAEMARREIIASSGVVSDCCGSAVLRNFSGDTICADCLNKCKCVEVVK